MSSNANGLDDRPSASGMGMGSWIRTCRSLIETAMRLPSHGLFMQLEAYSSLCIDGPLGGPPVRDTNRAYGAGQGTISTCSSWWVGSRQVSVIGPGYHMHNVSRAPPAPQRWPRAGQIDQTAEWGSLWSHSMETTGVKLRKFEMRCGLRAYVGACARMSWIPST